MRLQVISFIITGVLHTKNIFTQPNSPKDKPKSEHHPMLPDKIAHPPPSALLPNFPQTRRLTSPMSHSRAISSIHFNIHSFIHSFIDSFIHCRRTGLVRYRPAAPRAACWLTAAPAGLNVLQPDAERRCSRKQCRPVFGDVSGGVPRESMNEVLSGGPESGGGVRGPVEGPREGSGVRGRGQRVKVWSGLVRSTWEVCQSSGALVVRRRSWSARSALVSRG